MKKKYMLIKIIEIPLKSKKIIFNVKENFTIFFFYFLKVKYLCFYIISKNSKALQPSYFFFYIAKTHRLLKHNFVIFPFIGCFFIIFSFKAKIH